MLFGGSSDVLGEKLFKYFFHGPQSLILDAFIQAMAAMKAMLDTNKTIDFLYDVFFTSTDFSAGTSKPIIKKHFTSLLCCGLINVVYFAVLDIQLHRTNANPYGND